MHKHDVSLLIIGHGPKKHIRRFKEECGRLGLTDHVHFVGAISNEDRFELLRRSRVFLMTSYYESYGIVIVEAMSVGLPVVAYNLPVYGVFQSGVIKVEIRNNGAVCAAIVDLLEHPSHWQTASDAAIASSQEHTWEKVSKEILELCRQQNGQRPKSVHSDCDQSPPP